MVAGATVPLRITVNAEEISAKLLRWLIERHEAGNHIACLSSYCQASGMDLSQERTPIYDSIRARRGHPVRGLEFPGVFTRGEMIEYLIKFHPKASTHKVWSKSSTVTLLKICEDVRDWRGFDTEFPTDENLMIHEARLWRLIKTFPGEES